MIFSEATKAANTLAAIVPLLGGSTSKNDYQDALKLVEYLVEHEPDSVLVEMLISRIDAYENTAPEFADFNKRVADTDTGVALLRILMDQYGLNQSGFENEIGKKSLVSRILSGERSLTLEHMRALSNRFHIPVHSFID